MTERFTAVDVTSWDVADTESAGGDEKIWLTDPSGVAWLFKPRTEHEGWVQGEDWAERVATDLALHLGVPAASAELAFHRGRRGSISRTLVDRGWELQPGALLLSELVPGFRTQDPTRTGHTVENIRRALDGVSPPAGYETFTAFDVFTGYLVLDALIANQDRHEENWAVLRPLTGVGGTVLAGSYDHGSSLGFNLRDVKRSAHLADGTVDAYARKGRAQRFEKATDGRLTLVELAHRALGRASSTATDRWTTALVAVSAEVLQGTVGRVPELSDPARRFTLGLLTTNRRRLLHDD